jgi:uncharacterized protein
MRIEVHDSIANLKPHEWNRLAGDRFPFISHEFLLLAEQSGCVAEATGWIPRHIGIYDSSDTLVAAMPLYQKSHSWGEFVFDWSWAQAYHRAGIEYYPKLVSAAPFTPAPSSRLLTLNDSPELAAELLRQAMELAQDGGYSSLHILFPNPDELPAIESAGLKLRKDCQFHWHNHNYLNFDEFLNTFSSAKRKKARRDRRHVAESGVTFRWFGGQELDRSIWQDVYPLISNTFMQRGSLPYYNLDFLVEVSKRLPQTMHVVLAERNKEPIATAVFYRGADALYGRYWGCNTDINALHFETCYYQGIDFCIRHGIRRFEPGTQGEHKISRGFSPVTTWSAHWLAHPEFFSAIGRYLDEEHDYIERYIEAVGQHSPFRQGKTDE